MIYGKHGGGGIGWQTIPVLRSLQVVGGFELRHEDPHDVCQENHVEEQGQEAGDVDGPFEVFLGVDPALCVTGDPQAQAGVYCHWYYREHCWEQ